MITFELPKCPVCNSFSASINHGTCSDEVPKIEQSVRFHCGAIWYRRARKSRTIPMEIYGDWDPWTPSSICPKSQEMLLALKEKV